MPDRDRAARAAREVEEQLHQLGELRNAGSRDQQFKHWRQNTLTLIQRLWPRDPSKSERFRRIPFSAPSAKTEQRLVREFFERGCSEAVFFLRGLIGELEGKGIQAEPPPPKPVASELDASESPTPERAAWPQGEGSQIELEPPIESLNPKRREATIPVAPSPSGKGSVPRAPSRPEERTIPPTRSKPSTSAPAPTPPTSPPPSGGPPKKDASQSGADYRMRLKEMLGLERFDRERSAASTPRPTRRSDSTPPATPVSAPAPSSRAQSEPPAAPPPPSAVDQESAPSESRQSAQDFVRESPVLRAEGRPVARHQLPEPRPQALEIVPASIAELAGLLERFGVPEGRRAQLRALLAELAIDLEGPTPSWTVLSEAVTASLEFPALARALLLLVVPHLKRAA